MSALVEPSNPPQNTRKKIIQVLAGATIVIIAALILTATTSRTDYIEYWSSAKLLLHRADPYSPAGVFALEKAQGYNATRPIIMLNPPWALFLIAPLGFVSLRTGLFLWTLAGAGCVIVSAQLLNVPPKDRAFAYVFAPALASILMGQSSPFLLLGFCLFLRFHGSRPFLAGASLLLMAIKPHLFLIFWAVLLVDCLYRRRYSILTGGAAALAAASLFSMCFDPHVWQHYITMFQGYKLQQGFLPTASMLFRMLIDVRAFWLLFVPSILAIFWGLWYYARWKREWDWKIQGMLLMLVTVLVSPYGYFTDEIVLLPSILFALGFPEKRKHSAWLLLAINTIALYIALLHHAPLGSRAYMWTPVTWLVWFLYATYGSRQQRHDRNATANSLETTTSLEGG